MATPTPVREHDGTAGPAHDDRRDAVAAAALTLVRRAIVEGTPVTRATLAHEASVALCEDEHHALLELDAEAQRLGVSALL